MSLEICKLRTRNKGDRKSRKQKRLALGGRSRSLSDRKELFAGPGETTHAEADTARRTCDLQRKTTWKSGTKFLTLLHVPVTSVSFKNEEPTIQALGKHEPLPGGETQTDPRLRQDGTSHSPGTGPPASEAFG